MPMFITVFSIFLSHQNLKNGIMYVMKKTLQIHQGLCQHPTWYKALGSLDRPFCIDHLEKKELKHVEPEKDSKI